MMNFIIKKPVRLSWISEQSWKLLKLKEKDFIIMLSARKYTNKQIMRRLYITDHSNYWRIQKRVEETLSVDIAKRNEKYEKALRNAKI